MCVERGDPVAIDKPDSENVLVVVGYKGISTVVAVLIEIVIIRSLSKSLRCSAKIISIRFLLISVECSVKSSLVCIDPCGLRGPDRRRMVARRQK